MARASFNSTRREHENEGVNAAFMRNHRGEVCIAFPDPSWVRADSIIVDQRNGAVHAVIHESCNLLGHVSPAMAAAFVQRQAALLTALRPDGTVFELVAPVQISSG